MENGTKPNKRELSVEIGGNEKKEKKICVHCGFGITGILQVAHIDQNRNNKDPKNLVVLCPTCHRMLDTGLISKETIIEMRDRSKILNWNGLFKDAHKKRAETIMANKLKDKHQAAGRKAAAKRQQNRLKDIIK